MHTLLDLHGNIPTFIRITDGKTHDVNILDEFLPAPGAFSRIFNLMFYIPTFQRPSASLFIGARAR